MGVERERKRERARCIWEWNYKKDTSSCVRDSFDEAIKYKKNKREKEERTSICFCHMKESHVTHSRKVTSTNENEHSQKNRQNDIGRKEEWEERNTKLQEYTGQNKTTTTTAATATAAVILRKHVC